MLTQHLLIDITFVLIIQGAIYEWLETRGMLKTSQQFAQHVRFCMTRTLHILRLNG